MSFDEFWALYPRRVSKKEAMTAWSRLDEGKQFEVIQSLPIHVRYWSLSGTTKEFIPYPATWLNGERWTDELEMPEPTGGNAWMKSESGIATKAAQLGVTARPGEGYPELKARILAKERVA